MRDSSAICNGKLYKHLEITLTLFGILFTAFATLMLLRGMGFLVEQKIFIGLPFEAIEQTVFVGLLLMLIYGNIAYQLIIFDGRNLNPLHTLNVFGFEYSGIGRDRYKQQTTIRFKTAAEPAGVSLF